MTPALRRALHQAVDLVCDALADTPVRMPVTRARKPPTLPKDVTQEEIEAAEARLRQAGYRRKDRAA